MFISIFNRPVIRRVYRRPPLPEVTNEQKHELLTYLSTEVERWRILMDEAPITWSLRNMRSQWGNCRPQRRKLTFNLQLARVENPLRDYIIVHELSHLKVPNHGPEFKARMTEFMPDWKERKNALRLREKESYEKEKIKMG